MTLLEEIPSGTFHEGSIPVLETPRLALRAPRLEDAKAVAALANDRRIAENTRRIPHPYTQADAREFVSAAQNSAREISLMIILRNGSLIGGCGLNMLDGPAPEIGFDVVNSTFRNPALTASQVVAALQVTARPVLGVAYGRVDPVAAFRWLGLLAPSAAPAATPPAVTPPAAGPRAPAPGQRFTRQTLFETGTFKRGFRSTFRVGRGRFEMQLLTPHASSCTLYLRSAGELTVAAPAVRNLISLSVRVTAGRYTAEVQCSGARTRQYSLGVIAMFPRGGP